MIIVENISKSYGSQELFRKTGFKLNSRERLGLVGRNGDGKTTLFRLITGEEEADSGIITVPKGYTIGHVRQETDFTKDTVLGEGCEGLAEREKDHFWKVEKVLFGLGFSAEDLKKHPSELSGGFQVRLNLAKILVRDADLLLLDEPNNYLDITSIRWLTRYLNSWHGEIILITHDRAFMDNVVTHTMGIYRKTLRKIKGNTEKLYSQFAMEEEVYEKTRLNDEKKRKKSEEFIRRFRAKARLANMVQSRIKTLAKQEKLEKLEKARDLDFSFLSRPFNGKPVMHVKDISYGFDKEKPLFSDLSFSIGPYDRICVIGKNGKGKTTMLRTLGERLGVDSGEVAGNPTAHRAFYEQANADSLNDDRTVIEEIMSSNPEVTQQRARDISAMMMFEGDAAMKKIKVLSGGEKSRVMLGQIIAAPVNLLILDEPTNHLDMESCDALLEALIDFEGALIMVTHNEMFLHGLAERLVIFQGGNASLFEGSYQRFLETRGWDDEQVPVSGDDAEEKQRAGINRKEIRRKRQEIIREKNRILKPLEKRYGDLEKRIVEAEARLEGLHFAIEAASRDQDAAVIEEISREIHRCTKEIEESFEELESISGELDKQKKYFERSLGEFEDQAR
ncbi:MAG: ABC-F family ATP-binding cassette domain-containing protein [Candidatus Krumholzibacteriota bacterium]|nr:ABC-F family ATP-binding cassette domain-containing protein [Candidatus Krumholzibacteriota bacterium]